MNDNYLPPTVYIVEDSLLLLQRLVQAVKAAGGEVIGQSKHAQEAIDTLALLEPDVIIIDIRLNSGTGFDVLRALQRTNRSNGATKVVLTSYANSEYRALSLALGADGFFDKMNQVGDAMNVISSLVEERRTGAHAAEVRSG